MFNYYLSLLHQDSIHGVTNLDPETPRQDPQKICTRNSPCLQQGCIICSTRNNHIRNLDVALSCSNSTPTSLIIPNRPQLPTNHHILTLTVYDHSNLHVTHKLAMQILNSAPASSTPLPTSPPNSLIHTQPTPPTSVSFKPPKLVTDNWSIQSYDFYSWLPPAWMDSTWPGVTTLPNLF